MNTKIKLRVQGLTNSQIQTGAYALIMAEANGPRRIPIIVGTAEAQSIAIALEKIVPPRPLTHDLFSAFSSSFGIKLKEAFIYKFEDSIFYSELLFDDGTREVKIDSRTSDAIALALRMKCDIFTTPEILEECGVMLEEVDHKSSKKSSADRLLELEPDEIEDEATLKRWLAVIDAEELKERLSDAISEENYEYAKMYQDELERRKIEEA